MLVLSRRANETFRFPQLGISVTIVAVKGSRVQVGIDAPSEIQILRKEIEPGKELNSVDQLMPSNRDRQVSPKLELDDKARHDFKNRLNRATLGLHLAQKQLAAGKGLAADKTLSAALARLKELETAAFTSPATETTLTKSIAHDVKRDEPMGVTSEADEAPAECIDVLLVEDDQNEQILLRTLLEMEGFRVHTANNGLEAMKCMERITPRCVLLDMMMPECDGPETLQRMRANPALDALPVFAVSATSPESIGLTIGADRLDDWFPKPLNAPRLVKHIRNRVAMAIS